VDAGQAADVARHHAVQREQDGGRRDAGRRPVRVAVADAVRPVANGVARGDLDVRLGPPDGLAQPRLQGGERLGRDGRKPRRRQRVHRIIILSRGIVRRAV
jgi:hypothetical protein